MHILQRPYNNVYYSRGWKSSIKSCFCKDKPRKSYQLSLFLYSVLGTPTFICFVYHLPFCKSRFHQHLVYSIIKDTVLLLTLESHFWSQLVYDNQNWSKRKILHFQFCYWRFCHCMIIRFKINFFFCLKISVMGKILVTLNLFVRHQFFSINYYNLKSPIYYNNDIFK